MGEPQEKESWEEGRDFISLSRSPSYPRYRARRPPWRLLAAALFFVLVWALMRAPLPVPEEWRRTVSFYLTSPAADWTPGLARYFSLDSVGWRSFSLAGGKEGPMEAPALAPAGPSSATPPPESSGGGKVSARPDEKPVGFLAPLAGEVLRPFGRVASPVDDTQVPHLGVDLAAARGQPVRAGLDGRVKAVTAEGGLFTVRLSHAEDLETVYGRLSEVWVRVGEAVPAGQELGRSAGGWLHFAAERGGRPVDPGGWL